MPRKRLERSGSKARERDPFKSQRPLREQGSVKRAKFEFIAVFSCQYSVSELCSALKVTRQGYYAYRKSAASEHALRGAELAAKILEVYEASRRIYGSPKAFRVLKRGGERVSRKRAAGTMRENGWRGVTRRCAKNPEGESAPPRANRPPTW